MSFTSDICSFSTLPWRLFIISNCYQRHLLHQCEILHSPRVLQFLHLFFNEVQVLFSLLLGTTFIIWECIYRHSLMLGQTEVWTTLVSTAPLLPSQRSDSSQSPPILQTGETLPHCYFVTAPICMENHWLLQCDMHISLPGTVVIKCLVVMYHK